MDFDPIIDRHEGNEFETILLEKAVINKAEELSKDIFSQYFTAPSTDLILISQNSSSNMFSADILNNLKKQYDAKYPGKKFENSGIKSYTSDKLNNPSGLSGKRVLISNIIIDERNKGEIQTLLQSLSRGEQKPSSISLCTFISQLSDMEEKKLGIPYLGHPFPDNILLSGYGISTGDGELDLRSSQRVIYAKAKE